VSRDVPLADVLEPPLFGEGDAHVEDLVSSSFIERK